MSSSHAVAESYNTTVARETGIVRQFDSKKGYGFIENERSRNIFVHFSQIQGMEGYKELVVGQTVEFTPVQTEKGWQGKEVRVIR